MLTSHRSGLAFAALLALAACTASPEAAGTDQGLSSQQTFSAEDRRAAQLLSVGASEAHGTSSPRSYAMLCTLALESIGARLVDGDFLTAEQKRAFATAHETYRERALAGLPPDDQESLRLEVETAYPEAGARARFATGCLRLLVQA